MKRIKALSFTLAAAIVAALFFVVTPVTLFAAPAAQAIETPIQVPVSGVDFTLIDAILGLFGIGLVYVVNWIKKLIGWQDKKALIITVVASFMAAAGTLFVKGAFTWKLLLVYGLAVLGEMTGWFKFTKKAA